MLEKSTHVNVITKHPDWLDLHCVYIWNGYCCQSSSFVGYSAEVTLKALKETIRIEMPAVHNIRIIVNSWKSICTTHTQTHMYMHTEGIFAAPSYTFSRDDQQLLNTQFYISVSPIYS